MNEKIMYEYETEPVIQNNYKPLKKVLWFTPVAFLVPTIILEICKITFQVIGEIIYECGEHDLYNIINLASQFIVGFAILILFGLSTFLFSKLAFKKVDPLMKKKASVVTLLPFVGAWLHLILTDYLTDAFARVIYMISDYSEVWYYVGEASEYVISAFFAIIIVVILTLIASKIFKKAEKDNQ